MTSKTPGAVWKKTGRLSALVLAGLVEDVIGFVVLLIAQTAGLMNVMGWSNVLLYGIFALGFGYFHFSSES